MRLDKMTDEELAVATLGVMGYEQDPLNPWWYLKDGHAWMPRTALLGQEKHAFAAEVIDFMLKKNYRWEVSSKLGWGYVQFVETFRRMDNCALFNNMAEFPRAICIAALKVLNSV